MVPGGVEQRRARVAAKWGRPGGRFLGALAGLLLLAGCPSEPSGGTPVTPPSGKPDAGTGTDAGQVLGGVKGALTLFVGASSSVSQQAPAPAWAQLREKVAAQLQQSRAPVSSAALTVEPPSDAEVVPGELIVRFEDADVPVARALERVATPGLKAVHGGRIGAYLHPITFGDGKGKRPDAAATRALARALAHRPGVRYVEPNMRVYAQATPDDPLYELQWHYQLIGMPSAWDVTTGASTVRVAIIDTGSRPHPDLTYLPGVDMISSAQNAGDGNGRDMDPTDMGGDKPNGGSSWHGTHVAGTVAALSNNGKGVSGIAWNVGLVPVRVLGKEGGTSVDIAAGMTWAAGGHVDGVTDNANPAQVANMSLGGPLGGPLKLYQDVIDAFPGTTFVVAAGNSDEDSTTFAPCAQQRVICVGAVGQAGRASYSNWGAAVTLMAPGGELSQDLNADGYPDGVLSTYFDAQGKANASFLQGTSMASPHVAGIVALMKSVTPSLTFEQVRSALVSTASTDWTCPEGCGAGLVNVPAALAAVSSGSVPTGPAELSFTPTRLFLQAGSDAALTLFNTGGTGASVTATASCQTAGVSLSFPDGSSRTVAAGTNVLLTVRANTSGVADGRYTCAVTLSASTGGTGTVDVLVQKGTGLPAGTGAVAALVYLDALGEWQVEAAAETTTDGSFAYALEGKPGPYYLFGVADLDGDGVFSETEPVGFYPTTESPEPVTLVQGEVLQGMDFVLAPLQTVTLGEVGAACTADAECAGGTCFQDASFPGGYCTADCLSTGVCPDGSGCFYDDTSHETAHCYDSCTGAGSQGDCRSGYACTGLTSGDAICLGG